MNKTAQIGKLFLAVFVGMILLSSNVLKTFAASSLYLNPTSGDIDADGTTLTLKFDSDGTEVAGASVKIAFTGDVTYTSSASTACDQSFDVQEGTGAIIVSCLFSDTKTYDGNLATFIFESSASSGSSVFTLSEPDPSDATVAGGTYTLVSTSDGDTGLPDTGIFDLPIYSVAGFVLILFGVGMFGFTKRSERILTEKSNQEYEEFINSPKMKRKL